MRRFALLLLASAACGAPDLSLAPRLEYDAAGRKTRERAEYRDGRVYETLWTWCA